MQTNVIGRIRNTSLPKSHALLPLFEAVVNSVDAIEDANILPKDGKVEIHINRIPSLLSSDSLEPDQRYKGPISGFVVADNGIGFTDSNFASFDEADTMIKYQKGGKGVGRFIWLKAFDYVKIQSVFQMNDHFFERSFIFSLNTPNGIQDHVKTNIGENGERKTIVTLEGYREIYEANCPKQTITIAQRIVEHCLGYFLLGRMPTVIIYDDDEVEPIDLWSVYSGLIERQSPVDFKLRDHKFKLINFFLHARGEMKHHLCYCANNRVVKNELIGTKIPNLSNIIEKNGEDFIYAGYILSDYLDEKVNQQRTGFDSILENGFEFPGELNIIEIENEAITKSKEFLKPFTDQIKVQKTERIGNYVKENAPQYRHILKNHPDHLDNIPAEVSDSKLDTCLYEISRQIETNLRDESGEIFAHMGNLEDENSYEDYMNRVSKWWQEYNDVGKSNLAKYIVQRRVILQLLEESLKIQENKKYPKEELIHRIIFPLKATSDDISYDKHNLWVLDEKLSYHNYLASDLSLRKTEVIDINSNLRPDLLFFFNNPIAVVEEDEPYFSGIVIFEFKRPMRDDYSDEENPIPQIYDYIKNIKAGKAITREGRPFTISQSTPIYCYIVCDLTPSLIEQALNYNLKGTPDNSGFVGYNDNLGAYVEIISFGKLLSDAKKRNRILFDYLQIPIKF